MKMKVEANAIHNRFPDFEQFLQGQLEEIQSTLAEKGKNYSENADVLANVKRTAEICSISPERAMFVLMAKHIAALNRFSERYVCRTELEQWQEKCTDIACYAILMLYSAKLRFFVDFGCGGEGEKE